MLGCNPIWTPIKVNHKLGKKKERAVVDRGTYQRMVEKLIYLSHTRPNISYLVRVVS